METKTYEHNFAKDGICNKCHKNLRQLIKMDISLTMCPVIGKEEVAEFRDYDER